MHQRFVVDDASHVGAVRRAAGLLAMEAGASEVNMGNAAIVASELTRNVINHAGRGEILLALSGEDALSLDILAVDRGPGMDNVERCLTDGYSTAGTPGTGLGAVRRLASAFDVYSDPGNGTVIFARIACGKASPANAACLYGAVSLAYPTEPVCGDGWRLAHKGGAVAAMVVDGLGHGLPACEAAREALAVFDEDPFAAPTETMQRAHQRMSSTRGAALAVASLAAGPDGLTFSGVGNIGASLITGGAPRGLVSQNGIVGGRMPAPRQITYPVAADALLVMHSDGLQSRWKLADYPGLTMRHPAVIAGILYRDFNRGNDDLTVLVVAMRRSS